MVADGVRDPFGLLLLVLGHDRLAGVFLLECFPDLATAVALLGFLLVTRPVRAVPEDELALVPFGLEGRGMSRAPQRRECRFLVDVVAPVIV